MSARYEAIVIGGGGLGAAALYALSSALGERVLCLEQFDLGHARGSSDDHSRMTRLAQSSIAHARLIRAAHEAWHDLEANAGQTVIHKTGGLVIDACDAAEGKERTLGDYVESCDAVGIPYEVLSADDVNQRWPQFRLNGTERALYQQDAGIVHANRATMTHIALAVSNQASVLANTKVLAIHPTGDCVDVETTAGTFHAQRVVLAAGAWTNQVLSAELFPQPLTVTQEQVTYYATPHRQAFLPHRFPVFIWHGERSFYGFPVFGETATKLGEHLGGPRTTADARTFEADPARRERYRGFLAEHLPDFLGPELYTKTCLYCMPADQDFILDVLPDQPNIAVAVGGGHGYKFAALFGHILRDLLLEGGTPHPIEEFRLSRPSLAAR